MKRLPGPPDLSAAEMGAAGKRTCRSQGEATGRMLRDVGFNVDLAPVLDVGRPGSAIDVGGTVVRRRPEARRALRGRVRRGARAQGRRADRQALPGTRRGGRQHRRRGAADRSGGSRAAAGRRGALPTLRRRRRGRPAGDGLERRLPGLLRAPGGADPRAGERGAARPARLRRRLDHRRARDREHRRVRRPDRGGRSAPRAPVPTCSCSRARTPPFRAGRSLRALLQATRIAAPVRDLGRAGARSAGSGRRLKTGRISCARAGRCRRRR